MPQKKNNQGPPPVMTWGKASPVLIIALIFDALRFMFEMFWFFGPALAALYCTIKVGDTVGTMFGGFLCTTVAAVAGTFGVGPLETFGVVMAMATGFAGWLVVGGLIMMFNSRILKENALWFAGSLLVSEIPIVGSIPAITLVVWKMYRTQISMEEAAMKAYKAAQAAQQLQERKRRAAHLIQARTAELAAADVY